MANDQAAPGIAQSLLFEYSIVPSDAIREFSRAAAQDPGDDRRPQTVRHYQAAEEIVAGAALLLSFGDRSSKPE
jgi:hypothetical protein